MTEVARIRQALGARLRELRKGARLTGQQLGDAAGWHWSKVSRIENGKQLPSEADVETWCRHCDAELAIPDLIASLRNVQAQWAEWKRIAAGGHARRQRRGVELDAATTLVRIYSANVVSGILQTEAYARAVLSTCIGFLGALDDLDAAVAARLERQRALHTGVTRYAILIHESALYVDVADPAVRAVQLQYLLDAGFDNVRLLLGIVPTAHRFIYTTTSFTMYDARMALVETISAELTINAPSELALYERTWTALQGQAVFGDNAKTLIAQAIPDA
ncbi:helix-turn-helix domain-containing protein [Nocardia otitidiscaviarum]|uniref:Helix-turn-helix domain-containing protein n=1 Tax=Nocardia otitidiscaviarum TaxID=1823 RepID=A0A516NPN0_9NOCA|nr:helix-turn-helix transcriptional regulator [Nocardia otitidiscaviarum]MCP9623874.1 helix-turn-helix domain-containing protein [Nocardia otitidiscaviarum]QDP80835.1 helix-turn-helix domain-containing protein [Nocardia otitidiscaviarum]